jgi:hypothetical protein
MNALLKAILQTLIAGASQSALAATQANAPFKAIGQAALGGAAFSGLSFLNAYLATLHPTVAPSVATVTAVTPQVR